MAPVLAETLLSTVLSEAAILERGQRIHQALLAQSRYVRTPNFRSVHPGDLRFLFQAYDREFFDGRMAEAMNGLRLDFRFSSRMTKAGGTTARLRYVSTGAVSYEITIASTLLFEGFNESDRAITACGLECPTRLHALQRIFEHELIHLGEQLCWGESSCSARRFQDIAVRLFSHRAHTHDLITRRERAAQAGIHLGSAVSFQCEGRRLSGRVSRITKRASVLVPDPCGEPFSDGGRYVTYYVPIRGLTLLDKEPNPVDAINCPAAAAGRRTPLPTDSL